MDTANLETNETIPDHHDDMDHDHFHYNAKVEFKIHYMNEYVDLLPLTFLSPLMLYHPEKLKSP